MQVVNVTAVIADPVTEEPCKYRRLLGLWPDWRPQEIQLATAIIKNCAYVHEATDPIDDSFVRAPQWQRCFGRRWSSYVGGVGNQAFCEEDSQTLQQQDCCRIRGIDGGRLHTVQPFRSQAGAVPRQPWPRSG